MLFIAHDIWEVLLSKKVYFCHKVLFNVPILAFFNISDLKEDIFTFYLHNNRTMLIPKFQNEALTYHTC